MNDVYIRFVRIKEGEAFCEVIYASDMLPVPKATFREGDVLTFNVAARALKDISVAVTRA